MSNVVKMADYKSRKAPSPVKYEEPAAAQRTAFLPFLVLSITVLVGLSFIFA